MKRDSALILTEPLLRSLPQSGSGTPVRIGKSRAALSSPCHPIPLRIKARDVGSEGVGDKKSKPIKAYQHMPLVAGIDKIYLSRWFRRFYHVPRTLLARDIVLSCQ